MSDMTAMRESGWLWALRLVQLFIDLIALGVAGANASGWRGIDCSIPPNLSFAIAVAAISLPLVLYLVSATGGRRQCAKMLPWNGWFQLGFDVLFVIIWIATVATEHYKCDSVCAACSAGGAEVDVGSGYSVTFGNTLCNCMFDDDFYRLRGRSVAGTKGAVSVAAIAIKVGAGAVMLILFFVTMSLDAYYLHKGRTSYAKLPAGNSSMPLQVPLMKTPHQNTMELEPSAFEQATTYGYHPTDGYKSRPVQHQMPVMDSMQATSTGQYYYPPPPIYSYDNRGTRPYSGVEQGI